MFTNHCQIKLSESIKKVDEKPYWLRFGVFKTISDNLWVEQKLEFVIVFWLVRLKNPDPEVRLSYVLDSVLVPFGVGKSLNSNGAL